MENSFWNYYTTRVIVTITTSHLYRPVLFTQHIITYVIALKIVRTNVHSKQGKGGHGEGAA